MTAFDVVDVLDGFTKLTRRSGTLGGSVPLRVAQACVPLLEGNAWGFQIALARRIALHKRFGRWSVAGFEGGDELTALLRGGIPMMDVLAPAWRARLAQGVVVGGRAISLFTGLFVRPRDGLRLRQSSTANRRSYAYAIDEAILDDGSGFVPLVLDVVPRADVDSFTLEAEIATLAVLPARVTIARTAIAEAPEVARAHVGFYDAAYFATKTSGAVARKYRDELRAAKDQLAPRDEVGLTIIDGGPLLVEPAPPTRVHRVTGPAAGTLVDRLVVRNAVAFEAMFDGSHVAVEPDRDQLDRYAREVRGVWEAWFARAGVDAHQGALLYLTKYVTPHPPGEPHFFTKPATLVQTTAGASTVIEGKPGAGYDVMRGVVRTDTFHATPSVFHLWQVGRTIAVAQGAVLAELVPTPRALIDATFELAPGGAAAARWGAR